MRGLGRGSAGAGPKGEGEAEGKGEKGWLAGRSSSRPMETRMAGGAGAGGSSREAEGHAGSRGEGASVGMMAEGDASGVCVPEARAGEARGRGVWPLSETGPGAEASGRSGSEPRSEAVRDAGTGVWGAEPCPGRPEEAGAEGCAKSSCRAECHGAEEEGSTEPVTGSAGALAAEAGSAVLVTEGAGARAGEAGSAGSRVGAVAGSLRVERVGWAAGDGGAGGTTGRGAWPMAGARACVTGAVCAASA